MAYRGGGGRGVGEQQHPAYGGRGPPMVDRGGGQHPAYGGRGPPMVGRGTGIVWSPPGPSTSRPAAPVPYTPATAVYLNPGATGPHVGAYEHGVIYRTPAQTPYEPAAPVTILALPPSPATVRDPSSAAAPFQPARVSAPPPAPATPAPTPSTASIAKELEQKIFAAETPLAPRADAAAAVAAQPAAEKAPEVDLVPRLAHPAHPGACTAERKVIICANHFLINVAVDNLLHYDVSLDPESTSRQTNREVLSELIKVHRKTSRGGKLPAYDGGKNQCNVSSLPFQSKEFSVALVGTEKEDKEWTERAYNITIRIAGRTDLYHLHFVENKINLKAGGRNIVPAADVTHPPPVSEVPVIIFGADVTPPQPGEDSASIAGVVALMDWTEITKKRGLVSAQSHRQEIIEDLFNVTKDPQRGTFNGGMSRKLFIVQKRHHTKLFPEVQETSAENCLTADARLPSNFSGPAISNVLPVHSLESDNLKPDVGQDKPPDKINKIQALVKVLSFETFPLMVERHWSVQNVVSHAFLKLGVCFDPRVSFNHKEASLDQRISDLVNEECSVYIQARLLGGVHTYLRKIPLLKYITSIGSRLFDVVTLDPKLHYPDMVPYFIGLTPEPTSIILFLINLLHKKFHMRLKCPGRFTVESLLYKTPKKKVSFIPEVGEVDFSAEAYLYNMNDLGSVIFDLFRYDENLLLANSDNIHASGNKPLPSWKLPMLLELLVHDLKEGLAKFSHRLDVRENKKYLDTHLGLLSGPARTAYILTSELNVGYIHGENNLEKVVGLLRAQFVNQAAANQPPPVPEGQAAADQPPPVPQDQSAVDQLPPVPQDQSATDQHPPPPVPQNDAAADQPAPVLQNQDQAVPLSKLSRKRKRRQQNRLAAGNSQPQPPTAQPQAPPRKRKNRRAKKHVAIPKWNIKVERSYYLSKLLEGGRKYDFERIGAKWSYSRNWLSHAPSYVGWITLKQAEAYLQLTLAGLLYNIRLRTRFPEAKVDWGSSPRPVEKHPGADTTHINQAWCTNDFTEEEILQIG